MRFILSVCLLIPLAVSELVRGRPNNQFGFLGQHRNYNLQHLNKENLAQAQWFVQKLDHFNPADQTAWKQRYFVNATNFRPGGPVFLQLGGEGTADPIWLVESAPMMYAQKYGALMILLEHRYYGQSRPTEDLSVKNLAYLTSEQALADAATFITAIKKSYNLTDDNKWIVFGGSYSGSLAAWLRLKYPHLIHGSVASSAPLLAQYNFKEYLEVVRNSLATHSQQCVDNVAQAIKTVEDLISTKSGPRFLKKKLKLCDTLDVNNKNDVSSFFQVLSDLFNGIVQYNKDNRAFEGAKDSNITIDTLCDLMTQYVQPLDGLAAVNSLLQKTYQQSCLDFTYANVIKQVTGTSWNSSAAVGGRQWFYQTCVEFGFYQSSDFKDQPFGSHFPVEFYMQQCSDVFGPKYTLDLLEKGISWTNSNYGALGIKTTNIVFPNGSIDPWHALGVTKDLSKDATSIFINGTAHCANMYPPSDDDIPELVAARQQISTLIGQWLKQ